MFHTFRHGLLITAAFAVGIACGGPRAVESQTLLLASATISLGSWLLLGFWRHTAQRSAVRQAAAQRVQSLESRMNRHMAHRYRGDRQHIPAASSHHQYIPVVRSSLALPR